MFTSLQSSIFFPDFVATLLLFFVRYQQIIAIVRNQRQEDATR